MKFVLFLFISFALPVTASENDCEYWPKGMVFVGLTDASWETYAVTKAGQAPQKIAINTEARTPLMSSKNNALFYIDEAAQVSRFSFADKKVDVLLKPSKEASYAQPEIDEDNNALYIVQLKQGNSVDTDILRLDLATQTITPFIIQRSAQFEPMLSAPWLYYSHVHCVLGCGKIIQEIWRYHTISGIAEQITLLNNISRQPAVDHNNQWLYFSSNAAGNYHLYRQSLTQNNAPAELLTEGAVTDTAPVIVDNKLYFIRQQAQHVALMCRTQNGELHTMSLPKGITQLRDLEV